MLSLDLVNSNMVPYYQVVEPKTRIDITPGLLNLNITESMGKMLMVQMTYADSMGARAALDWGGELNINWGYKNVEPVVPVSADEISGFYKRGPIPVTIIQQPGEQGRDGQAYTTVSARLGKYVDTISHRRGHYSGTIKSMFEILAREIGAELFINFPNMNIPLSDSFGFYQHGETNQQFMLRVAKIYGCAYFHQHRSWHNPNTVQSSSIGVVYVVDPYMLQATVVPRNRGYGGRIHYCDYYTSTANIISYNFESNPSGNGSSITMMQGPNGPTLAIYPSKKDSTQGWVLSMKKVEAAFGNISLAEQMKKFTDIIKSGTQDIGDLRRKYFVPQTFTTAPEVSRRKGKLKVFPNPDYQVGDAIFLGPQNPKQASEFSPRIRSYVGERNSYWHITAISQSFSAAGYSMDVSIMQ